MHSGAEARSGGRGSCRAEPGFSPSIYHAEDGVSTVIFGRCASRPGGRGTRRAEQTKS